MADTVTPPDNKAILYSCQCADCDCRFFIQLEDAGREDGFTCPKCSSEGVDAYSKCLVRILAIEYLF